MVVFKIPFGFKRIKGFLSVVTAWVFSFILAIELKNVNYYFVDLVLDPSRITTGECVLKRIVKSSLKTCKSL